MRQGETFSSGGPERPLFLIGKNSRGQWVVQSQRGLCGGLFVSRTAALKYALFENGNRPELVITVPGVFELDMSRSAFAADRSPAHAEAGQPGLLA
jgi:hypothetical protein